MLSFNQILLINLTCNVSVFECVYNIIMIIIIIIIMESVGSCDNAKLTRTVFIFHIKLFDN